MHVNKQFLTAGHAIFTVEHLATAKRPAGHVTYKIDRAEPTAEYPNPAWFCRIFTGTENTNPRHYTYAGKLDPFYGVCNRTAQSAFPETSFRFRLLNRILCRVWGGELAAIEAAGYKLRHEGQCCRCGKALTNPVSIETGVGPECAKVMGISQERQLRKAKAPKPAVEVHEASDRPDVSDLSTLTPTYDAEGELLWWSGVRQDGTPVQIFND